MMKPETLSALLMDRELGELPPDARELLEAYLALVPGAQFEAAAVARVVGLARETVCQFPDLSRPAPGAGRHPKIRPLPWLRSGQVRAAAVVVVAAVAGLWAGYQTGLAAGASGRAKLAYSGGDRAPGAEAGRPRYEGLWTRYRVAYDGARKGFAVEECR